MLRPVTADAISTPGEPERVVLTGFMGSGKTTVGRVLAARLDWPFADLDEAIAFREGLSVPEIFAQHGEAAFRRAEFLALEDLLQPAGRVIALGGGAPETPAVRGLLKTRSRTAVVHLAAPFELLYERCLQQALDPASTHRPLLGEREAAAARYNRRLPLYAELAHHTAAVASGSPEQLAEEILARLGLHVTSG